MKKQLTDYAKEMMVKYPNHKSEIQDIYSLCMDEIEEGGSVEHECQLAMEDIRQLVGE